MQQTVFLSVCWVKSGAHKYRGTSLGLVDLHMFIFIQILLTTTTTTTRQLLPAVSRSGWPSSCDGRTSTVIEKKLILWQHYDTKLYINSTSSVCVWYSVGGATELSYPLLDSACGFQQFAECAPLCLLEISTRETDEVWLIPFACRHQDKSWICDTGYLN